MGDNIAERFKRSSRNHDMFIEIDQGVHRSILFESPNTSCYSFRIVTWPGHLAISGDLDDFTFRRLTDMFQFFRYAGPEYESSDGVNYGYWSEKVQSASKHGGLTKFSDDFYLAAIRSGLSSHISGMTLSEAKACVEDARLEDLLSSPGDTSEAISQAQNWLCPVTGEHPFTDFWDHRLEDHSFGFKFACHAIQWGIKRYDLHKQGRDQAAHDRRVLAGDKA